MKTLNTGSSRLLAFSALFALAALGAGGCAQSKHPVIAAPPFEAPDPPSDTVRPLEALLADMAEPGPIRFEKHVAADWTVPLEGMLNLKHEEARAAHLENHPEPIQIYFYILSHPDHGDFMVDSGVARSVAERKDMPVRFPVTMALPLDDMKVKLDTQSYLKSREAPLAGVFLTHLHLDHILGLEDIPKSTPLFVGPGETEDRRFTHALVRRTTDLNLKGFGPLKEWVTSRNNEGALAYVDVFSDGSVLGIHVPGHTKGSMAFLVRSTEGPRLITGDCSHTAWGWQHSVEPGTFNTDLEEAAASLDQLQLLAAKIPDVEVHLGHQRLPLAQETARR